MPGRLMVAVLLLVDVTCLAMAVSDDVLDDVFDDDVF